jgi:hypothetical protein
MHKHLSPQTLKKVTFDDKSAQDAADHHKPEIQCMYFLMYNYLSYLTLETQSIAHKYNIAGNSGITAIQFIRH